MLTEPLLRDMYWGDGLGLIEIGARTGFAFHAVAQRMNELGVPRRLKGYQVSIKMPAAAELERAYHGDGRTLEDAAAVFGVSVDTFRAWLDRCGIAARPMGFAGHDWVKPRAARPTSEALLSLAVTQNLSFEEIARRCGVTAPTVKRWLQEDGLTIDASDRRFSSFHIAQDGHEVRSGYELAVDNWLTDHGLQHVYEPVLPWPPVFSAPQMADFLVGKTYIEIFGVTGHEAYYAKTRSKLAQYTKYGLRVVAIYPEDFEGQTCWQQKLADGLADETANPKALAAPERPARPTGERLARLVVEERLSVGLLAEHYCVSESCIYQWLRGAGVQIPRRQKPSPEDLRQMYTEDRMTISDIVAASG